MRVTPQSPIEATATIEIDGDLVAPSDVHRRLWSPDALGAALLEAVDSLQESRPWALVDDLGLDPLYASSVGRVRRWSGDYNRHYGPLSPPVGLLKLTRYLDKQPGNSLGEAVATGPAKVLAELEERPVVEVRLSAGIVDDAHREQITRLLGYLDRLTPGVDVRLTGSRIDLRRLVEKHGADLPADVRERARSTLYSSSSTSNPEAVASAAIGEIGTGDRAEGYWETLTRLVDDDDPQVPQARLEHDSLLDAAPSTVRNRLSRLEDLGLIDAYDVGAKTLAATEAGLTALSMLRDRDPSRSGGATDSSDSSLVRDPRNQSLDRDTPYAHEGGEREDRPTAEGSAVSAGGSTSTPAARYLALHEHHRAAAAAPEGGGVALVDRSVDAQDDRREVGWSLDEDRREVVVSVEGHSAQALTAVRLCSALLNPKATSQVLTPENLDGGPAGSGLEGLALSNPYVLRRGRTIGWLRNVDAEGGRLLDRLRRARDELLEDLSAAADAADSGVYDDEDLRDLLRRAHGLMGVLMAVYDLLGYDVVREVRLPEPSAVDPDALAEFVLRSLSISSRYGAYTAHRTLYERRQEKRDDSLGAPDVDAAEPLGTISGSFVLVGAGVDEFRPYLEHPEEYLALQSDGENFAPFILDVEIADGNRREAHAVAVARLLPFKNLEATREAVSLLRATVSMYDAAEALSYLGKGDGRDLDRGDLRYGLSQIDAERLFPDLKGTTVSQVFGALLDAEGGQASTDTLASAAGVSTRSIQQNRDVLDRLAAAGFLEIVEAGPGEATRWAFKFPESAEIGGEEPVSSGSTLGFVVGKPPSGAPISTLTDALAEALYFLVDELQHPPPLDLGGEAALSALTGPLDERDLGPLLEVAPDLRGLVALLAKLLDAEREVPDSRPFRGSATLGELPEAAVNQATIEAAAG